MPCASARSERQNIARSMRCGSRPDKLTVVLMDVQLLDPRGSAVETPR
jgi:hypothetical protein